jgi:hypothetical protein
MIAKLLALFSLLLIATSSGCAMCDTCYPHGPHSGAFYGRAGSVLQPTPTAVVPQVVPGSPADVEPIVIE